MNRIARLQRRTVGTFALWSRSFGHWMKCPVPMETKLHVLNDAPPSKDLFVLLPGIQDLPLEFELAGFIEQAVSRKTNIDMIAVDAHIGYYVRESILDRLHEDIITPARTSGYERIWLVGASLGGLGSALYAGHFENDVYGVFLVAPYLGDRSLVAQIEKSGGPANWFPHRAVPAYQVALWNWLDNYFKEPNRTPKLFLGFGNRDKFAYTNQFLAEILPKDQVFTTEGGHNWSTWTTLWGQFLDHLSEKELAPH